MMRKTLLKWVDGLNLDTAALWFAPWDVTRIQGCSFQKLARREQWQHCMGYYICTSTRNEGCETPFICLTLI